MRFGRSKWNDGGSIERDPTGNDCLYYYVRAGDWSSAIAFEVRPRWMEPSADELELRVAGKRRTRFSALDRGERLKVLGRMAVEVARRNRHLRRFAVVAGEARATSSLVEVVASMEVLGLRLSEPDSGSARAVWERFESRQSLTARALRVVERWARRYGPARWRSRIDQDTEIVRVGRDLFRYRSGQRTALVQVELLLGNPGQVVYVSAVGYWESPFQRVEVDDESRQKMASDFGRYFSRLGLTFEVD